jgi:hypothetical protein
MTEGNPNDFTINKLDDKARKSALFKQELDIIQQEQIYVKKRIDLLKETLKEIPSTLPDYAILIAQLEMDQIQLDELQNKEEIIKDSINAIG